MRFVTFSALFLTMLANASMSLTAALSQQTSTISPEPPPRVPAHPLDRPSMPSRPPSNTNEQISEKISEITRKLSSISGRIELGRSEVQRWAGTAELYASFASAYQDEVLSCSNSKTRLLQQKERGANQVIIDELSAHIRFCDSEITRSQVKIRVFQQRLELMAKEVDKIDKEIPSFGEILDAYTKTLKRLEYERALAEKLEDVERGAEAFKAKKQ
jgi:hypothetical protein